MTDTNGNVTAVAPDPDAHAGKAPDNTATGTGGERSASLSAAQRRDAGLLNDGDTVVPQVPKNDGILEGRETQLRTADGKKATAPAVKEQDYERHTHQAEVQ